jgi:predicted NUDIX family NTP pyrophosphohydrolase
MARKSAGILMYRLRPDGVEVLLGHSGGPWWVRRDGGAWSIPKGEFDGSEEAQAAARREFREETGFEVAGELVPLTPRQKGGKLVIAFAVEGDCDASQATSNQFEMEWPRGSGNMQRFPELDRVEWFGIEQARHKILAAQAPLLDDLEAMLVAKGA